MNPITAVYFDGLSSVPHQVVLNLDDQNNELIISLNDCLTKVWLLDDINFQKLDICLEISNSKNPLEVLKITDPFFSENFISVLHKKGKLSAFERIMQRGFKVHAAIALGLLAGLILAYFYMVPFVGEKSVVLIPNDFDNYLSNQFLIDYLSENKVDTVKSEWLTNFGNTLDLKNEKKLGFVVIESDIVNAFALPDGKIVVFTGIIDKIKSFDELAALLAHEAAHINGRHSVKMLARNLAGYIFISAMFSDVNGIMTVIAENAESLQSLSYSRKFENEADREGVNLLINNNIQPKGMIKLFSRLKDDENLLPVFLSTHPVTDDRIQTISVIIKQTQFEVKPNSKLVYYFNKLKDAK